MLSTPWGDFDREFIDLTKKKKETCKLCKKETCEYDIFEIEITGGERIYDEFRQECDEENWIEDNYIMCKECYDGFMIMYKKWKNKNDKKRKIINSGCIRESI